MSQEAATQCKRIGEYFEGPEGQQRYEELVHYAEWQVRRSSWSTGQNSTRLSNGQSGQEVLHESVEHATTIGDEGKCVRRIPPEIPLGAAFRRIICSKVSHTYKSSESKMRRDPIATLPGGEELDMMETDKTYWQPNGDRMSADARALAYERSERFIEFARKDRIVYGILVLLRDEDLDGPAEAIAARLGIDVNEVYVSRKRLATLVKKFEEMGGQKQ